MCFEVNAESIDIKKLLQQDFLELSMRVISSANPNVNKSWFTPESMADALPTFINKPILGYFENGDFVSHNGEWSYDTETQMSYWDTLGKQGERILGVIREKDGVKIVDGEDGLKWIELTCCLWVQYGYKQVKKLLKDAIKAKEKGGPAKNVSVEVDILESEKLPDGVLKINKFNLVGITILGSRNGVKVEPGIENAGLSVIDIMGKEAFEAQSKAIRLAYEKMDGSNNVKEEVSQMDIEKTTENIGNENPATENQPEQFSSEEQTVTETVETSAQAEEQTQESTATTEESTATENFENNEAQEGTASAEETANEGVATDTTVTESEQTENASVEETATDGQYASEETSACPCETSTIIYDLTYLVDKMTSFATDIAYTCGYYTEFHQDQEAVIAFLDRIKRQNAEDAAVAGELLANATQEFRNSILNFEKEISEDTVSSLYKKYEAEKAKNAEYSEKIEAAKKAEFLKTAQEIIGYAELAEEDSKAMYAMCESGEVQDIDTLKNKIALKLFEDRISANKNKVSETVEKKTTEETVVYSAPVSEPEVSNIAETKQKKPMSCWDTLKEYNNN